MAIKTSADWRIEIDEITDTNQALISLAETEEREMTDDEQETFESNMTRLGEAKAGLISAEKFEQQKREIAASRIARTELTGPAATTAPALGAAERMNVQHRVGPMNAFKGPNAARDAYDCGMWLRAICARSARSVDEEAEAQIARRGWDVMNIATEGTPASGGFLVPTPLSNAIIDIRALAGVSRQLCRVVPMTAETLAIAKKTAGTTVYYPGETGTITDSDQTWAQIPLTAIKRAILSKISQELRDDAVIAVIDDLASQMGTDFAVKEDSELFNGDGTAAFGNVTGLLAAIGAAGVHTPAPGAAATWGGLTIENFTSAMALLEDKYWQFGPVWTCSSAFYFASMLKVQAEAGGNTINTLESGATSRPMFLGYPVFFTNQMAKTSAVATISAMFGAFNQGAIIGDRLGIALAQSEHLGFAEDVLAVRATTRYDINAHDVGDATDSGAVVALSTAAS